MVIVRITLRSQHVGEIGLFIKHTFGKKTNGRNLIMVPAGILHCVTYQLETDVFATELLVHFRVLDDHFVRLTHGINHFCQHISIFFNKKKTVVLLLFLLYNHQFFFKTKKFICSNAVPVAFLQCMKMIANKYWWWHTNSSGVL